jgi:Glycosyltransferase family 87/Dipeptidyl peptidase IV (DPP IV) N-terminal region/WD40-like Beta Propeller Repeat
MKAAEATTAREPVSDKALRHISIGSIAFPGKWLEVAEWTLLALLLAQMCFRTLPKAWQSLNSDFPNYYLTARLVREHYDTSRVYEWVWLQRQKDHRDIDQTTVGMAPITAFSTLALYPFASMPALAAKRCWLTLNLGFLLATFWLLQRATTLSWRRILLIAALSFPLRVNFLLGQYYVLLLFLLTLACWLYLGQRRFMAGVFVGLAGGLKIFPFVYLLFFLRKRDWRAFAGGLVTSLSILAASITIFGWELNRTYFTQVLPATFRGECLAPYNLQAASISSLLHRLFIYEPQLNPHPAANIPWVFSFLHPLLLMAVMAPAILLAVPYEHSSRRVQLEWATVLLASLAISTSPASYLFTLLILPVALIWGTQRERGRYLWVAVLLLLYVAAGSLGGKDGGRDGWASLIEVPRLYALILLVAFSYIISFRQYTLREPRRDVVPWTVALLAFLIFNVATNLRHQRGIYADYKWRFAEPAGMLSATRPSIEDDSTLFIGLRSDGYHSAIARGDIVTFSDKVDGDHLAITAANGEHWIEEARTNSTLRSTLVGRTDIRHAELPVASSDGRWLAFLREDHGRARIWVRTLDQRGQEETPLTPPELNVLEMSFLPQGSLIFSANTAEHSSLYIADLSGSVKSFNIDDARYPSVSPDGHWLAYSRLQRGTWNLWLRNLSNGQTSRLTDAECNDTDATWTADSRTLVYASDCGRGLWLSALSRRTVIP